MSKVSIVKWEKYSRNILEWSFKTFVMARIKKKHLVTLCHTRKTFSLFLTLTSERSKNCDEEIGAIQVEK